MRRRTPTDIPVIMLALGTALLAGTLIAWFAVLPDSGPGLAVTAPAPPPSPAMSAATASVTAPAPTTTSATTTAAQATTATTAGPVSPPPVAMSWEGAGGMVVHTDSIDPTVFGQELRAAGFGWVAVLLADGQNAAVLTPTWIERLRAASGLPVGGWSVLRDRPVADARLAARLVVVNRLDFFIADAEQEYGYTVGTQQSSRRYARSREFVDAFRAAEPSLPAGLSSYCRPDQHDLDWAAWAQASFVFLPQAYVNDLGLSVSPATCVSAAANFYPRSAIHPTLGISGGSYDIPSPQTYGQMLATAGTQGFSIYPAENLGDAWQAYGQTIRALDIAHPS